MRQNASKTPTGRGSGPDLSLPDYDGYHYDPERATKRRVIAYSPAEFKKLSKDEQRRVLRNRETAAASKARKRQRLQDLQDKAAELEADRKQLESKVQAAEQALQKARAGTATMLQGCGCEQCTELEGQLANIAAASAAMMPTA